MDELRDRDCRKDDACDMIAFGPTTATVILQLSTCTLLLLPLLKLLFQMLLQRLELIFVVLATPPALHVPARPVSRLESLAPLLKRKLIHLHEKRTVEA